MRRIACCAAAFLLAACGSAPAARKAPATPTDMQSRAPSTAIASPSVQTRAPVPSRTSTTCAARALPDPNRPHVQLTFRFADDLRSVEGTEHVTFTPDLPITELVFRLTPNSPGIVGRGNRLDVLTASSPNGTGGFTFTRAGAAASTQGGLLHLPLRHREPAGTALTADLTFRVTVGGAYYERVGSSGGFAWLGSAQPLLAWERGVGWHTEDMTAIPAAETATSEAMDTTLTVSAPAADTVLMSGNPTTSTRVGTNRVWRSHLDAARDVSVAVGPFVVTDTTVDGVALRVGSYSRWSRDTLVPIFTRAIAGLAARFGPYPFPSLSVARVPGDRGGGIEYPAAIQMQSESVTDAVHETAHQWFYAMVGDSQSLHPWLDEAFAEYAERLVDDRPEPTSWLTYPGTVDRSIEAYGSDSYAYFNVTYAKGAAALEAARRAAGPAAWDRAVRCFVDANAWRIVEPDDVARAIAPFPAAVAILRRAGALP